MLIFQNSVTNIMALNGLTERITVYPAGTSSLYHNVFLKINSTSQQEIDQAYYTSQCC